MNTQPKIRIVSVIVAGWILTVSSAMAQAECVWTNALSGNWSANVNWSDGNVATGGTGRAWFTNAVSANCTVNLDSSPWTVNSLVFSNSGAYAFAVTNGTLNLGGTSPTITVNGGCTATVVSALSGIAGMAKADVGTLVLSGSNTYDGVTSINGGTLRLQSAYLPAAVREWNADSLTGVNGSTVSTWTDVVAGKNATGTAVPTLATGVINGHNAVVFNGSQNLIVAAGDSSVSGASAFTVAVVFKPAASGAGAGGTPWYQNSGLVDSEQSGATQDWGLEWNGANQVVAGIGNPDATKASATIGLNAAHVAIYSWSSNGLMTLNVDGTTVTNLSTAKAARNSNQFVIGKCLTSSAYFNGQMADIQFFNKALSSSDINSLGYSLAQTYGISATYTCTPDHVPSLPVMASLSIASGGTLDLNGFGQTIQTLSGAGTVDTKMLSGTPTLTVNEATDTTFSGALNNSTGTLSLVKAGNATLTLSGTSAYRGGTTVSQGTLVVANAAALGTPVSTLSVSNGATLSVNAGTGSTGLAWVYYASTPGSQGTFTGSLVNIQSALSGVTPTRIVTATNLVYGSNAVFPIVPADYSQALCSGMFKITTSGTYTFQRTLQDDDAAIFIDGVALVPGVSMSTNQPWALPAMSSMVDLTAGYHSITVPWYQGFGGATLYIQWRGPDTGNNLVNFTTASAVLTPDLYIANLSGAGNVALTTGNLFAGCNNANASFSGILSGIGGLNKWGSGTLTLSGTNTYSGATVILGGALTITGAGQLGGGNYAGDIVNNAALNYDSSALQTLNGVISGTGSLTKSGTGLLTLSGAGTYSGVTTVSGGTLKLESAPLPAAVREWNADSLTGVNGSSVTSWTDSIAGRNASVGNTAPTLAAGAINGHNAVAFDGIQTQNLFVAAIDSPVSGASALTVAVVFKPATNGVGAGGSAWYNCSGLVDAEMPGYQNDWGLEWNGANQVAAGIGNPDTTKSSASIGLNAAHVAIYSWNGSTGLMTLSVDGLMSTLGTTATVARSSNPFAIGKCLTSTNCFSGQIANIRFYGTVLSSAEMRRLSYSLAQTYGITSPAIFSPGSLSAATTLSVASGASLVLADVGQTVTRLQGSGAVTGGTLKVTGSIVPGGTNSVGTLSVTNLVMAENSIYDWNYSDASSDTVSVSGMLTLPSVATVNVSRVTGATARLPHSAILFSCGAVVTNPDAAKKWVVMGGRADSRVSVQGKNVVLLSVNGTMVLLL